MGQKEKRKEELSSQTRGKDFFKKVTRFELFDRTFEKTALQDLNTFTMVNMTANFVIRQ